MHNQIISRLTGWMTLILMLVVVGSCGYIILEGWSLVDSFYMTVITLSTVGFGEANELSFAGRIYTAILIICSMLMVTCWTAGITSMVVNGDFSRAFYQSKANKMAKNSKDHTVVCGDGQFVELVVEELLGTGNKVVFLSSDDSQRKTIAKKFNGVAAIDGSPLDEDALLSTNIINASNLVAVMQSEHDNLLISMTAKEINSNLRVMAKADSSPVATRMRRSGIDGVISPLQLGAYSISDQINHVDEEQHTLEQVDSMRNEIDEFRSSTEIAIGSVAGGPAS